MSNIFTLPKYLKLTEEHFKNSNDSNFHLTGSTTANEWRLSRVRPHTYVDIDVDVRGQAGQGIDINVVITELWGGGPSRCAGGGSGSRGRRCNCKWKKVSCWLQNAILIKILEGEEALPGWMQSKSSRN